MLLFREHKGGRDFLAVRASPASSRSGCPDSCRNPEEAAVHARRAKEQTGAVLFLLKKRSGETKFRFDIQ